MQDKTITPTKNVDGGVTAGVQAIQDTMDKFIEAASVNAVYGHPIQHGDNLIIPSAEVVSALGFGVGFGLEPAEEQNNAQVENGGGGGGGGGKVISRPVAVIIAGPEGVRVEPVFDITKIAIAALTTFGFMAGMIARMSNPKKAAH
jgi:uncharacterized spore protein YtfJ